ncbi:hypothetical protein [Nitratiruptor sp. SB155-2]|uniref:hypothetical protein n=1 Tax=Nitratiruptor sp. (strain SB155-2) TaxID=387092 RepID=UPI0001587362|nr:hypothetical protein [Nitratiruptor sp. SB155-2]BAF70459.1 hypothetical protein NIS_1351 [Nitratiruptor sp. SB155-2]
MKKVILFLMILSSMIANGNVLEDLCYETPSYNPEPEGLPPIAFCTNFGLFKGGMNCKETIPISNRGSDKLIDVKVVLRISGFSGSVFSECGIDGQEGNCTQENSFDFGELGIFNHAIVYNPMPDYDANETHTIYFKSLVNNAIFLGNNLYGSFTKNNQNYSGKIEACPQTTTNLETNRTSNSIDVVDNFIESAYEQGKGLKTKIINQSITVDVIYLGDDNKTPSTNEGVDIPVLLYLVDDNCSNPKKLYDDNGNPLVAVIGQGSKYGTSESFTIKQIAKAKRFGMKYIDYNKLYKKHHFECLKHSSTTQNAVPGLPACLASDNNYKAAFGEEAYQRCNKHCKPCESNHHGEKEHFCNHESCKSNHKDKGEHDYNHKYGCYECTLENSPLICSTDNFAIRPYGFRVFGKNEYKRAGEEFNLTIKTVDKSNFTRNSGTINTVKSIDNYNESIGNLNITSSFFTPSSDEIKQMQRDTGKTDVTSCPASGTFSLIQSPSFMNGEVNASLKFSETGILKVNVSEKPGHEWAIVDADDTNDTLRFIKPATEIYDINDINKTNILLFIPYQFDTNAEYKTTTNQNWVYMSNQVRNANSIYSSPKMAAYINFKITAKNKDGEITKNFTKTCFPDVDEANAPRINGLKLNSTFDLFLDFTLNSNKNVPLSLYTEDNASHPIWTLNKTYDLNRSKNSLQEWISPFQFEHGIGEAKVYFNLDRNKNIPLNPVILKVVDANTSTSWMNNPGATKVFNGTYINKSIYFYYGRVISPDKTVKGNTASTQIYFEVYDSNASDPGNIEGSESLLTPHWFVNTKHNSTALGQIFNLSLKSPVNSSFVNLPPSSALSTITAGTIPIQISYSGTIYPYHALIEINASSWLIYNKFDQNATTVPFEITFMSGTKWKGFGGSFENNTSENRLNQKPLQRIEW